MDIKAFLLPSNVWIQAAAPEKSRLLTDLSSKAAAALRLNPDMVADQILRREALGSTGIGGGVAMPHARIQGLETAYGIFVRLSDPIDFKAIDDRPVDLVFFLLLPGTAKGEQLSALACVARKLRDPDALRGLRSAADGAALYDVMVAN